MIPREQTGRLSPEYPLFTGHSGAVLDLDFSPFNDNLIASCSEDSTIKIWQVPQQMTEDISTPLLTLKKHQRKVSNVLFHPVASNVLASSSFDQSIRLWDLEKETDRVCLQEFPEAVCSFAFNVSGSLICSTSKDKRVRVHDAHSGKAVAEAEGHAGVKTTRITWMGDSPYFLTTGFSRTSERQMTVWDSRQMGATGGVKTEMLDSSSGLLMPFFDADTNVLFLAGKGDGNIRYWEFVNGSLFFLAEFQSSCSQKGMGWMPKRGVGVLDNEIALMFKVCSSWIEPVSFRVPRKSDVFQPDIFAPTSSSEPALTAEQFFGGANAKPLTMTFDEGLGQWKEPTSKNSSLAKSICKTIDSAKAQEKKPEPAKTAAVQAEHCKISSPKLANALNASESPKLWTPLHKDLCVTDELIMLKKRVVELEGKVEYLMMNKK